MRAGLNRLREYGPFFWCLVLIVLFLVASAVWSLVGTDDRYFWPSTLLSAQVFGALVAGSIVVIGWYKSESLRVRSVLRDRVEEVVAAWDALASATAPTETWLALLGVVADEAVGGRLDVETEAFVWARADAIADPARSTGPAGPSGTRVADHRVVLAELERVHERLASPRVRFAVHERLLPELRAARRQWQDAVRRLEAQVIGHDELWGPALAADDAVDRFADLVVAGTPYSPARAAAFAAAEEAVAALAELVGARLVDPADDAPPVRGGPGSVAG